MKNDNDFIIKPECRHWRYSLNKEGATEIRVVPAIDPNTGAPEALIDDSRGTEMYEKLTNAMAFVDIVTFLGPGKAHMICPIIEGEQQGPVQYFISAIQNAVKNDPKGADVTWLQWCGMQGGKDVMSTPSSVVLLQGFLYTHKGSACTDRDGNPGPKSPVVLQLNRSATKELCDKLGKPADPNGAWGSKNNMLGDFVDPQTGRILCFTPYQTTHMNRTQTWYHADCGQAVIPLTMDDILSVWKPWDQVLNLSPTLPEVGGWLVKAFDASSVVKILGNHPTYSACVTDQIRMIAEREEQSRTQVGYTGYGQPYPPYPQSGYAQPPQGAYPAPPAYQAPQPAPAQQAWPPQPQTLQQGPDAAAYPAPAQAQYAPPNAGHQPPPAYNPPVGLTEEDGDLPFDQQPQQNVSIRRPRR